MLLMVDGVREKRCGQCLQDERIGADSFQIVNSGLSEYSIAIEETELQV